jgi:hypothetical protein
LGIDERPLMTSVTRSPLAKQDQQGHLIGLSQSPGWEARRLIDRMVSDR